MKKVRRRIQWNFCDFSVMCMLENGISSLPCWIQLNGHWLPISPGVSLYLMHLVHPQVSKCLFSIIFQTDSGPTSTTTIHLKTNSKPGLWQPQTVAFIFLVCRIFHVQLANNAAFCGISDSAMLVIFLCFLYDVPFSGKSGSLFEGSISTDGNVSILFPLWIYYINLNVAHPWFFHFPFLSTRMRQLSNFHPSHS